MMRSIVVIVFFLSMYCTSFSYACSGDISVFSYDSVNHSYSRSGEEPVRAIDRPARFDGNLKGFVADHINYPEKALSLGVDGTVVVEFTVKKDGTLTDIKIKKKLGYGCDEEAVRILKSMPRWIPAEINGEKVDAVYNLPIVFRLEQ